MKHLKTKKILVATIIVLLLTNIVMLSLFWTTHHKKHREAKRPQMHYFLHKSLNLNPSQQEQLKKTMRKKEDFHSIFIKINQNKKQLLLQALKEQPRQTTIDSLIKEIKQNQTLLEKEMYNHIYQTSKILNTMQKQKLKKIIEQKMSCEKYHPPKGNRLN